MQLPFCHGDIEIQVPERVKGNITVTTRRGEAVMCPVRNGVVRVDEDAAEVLLNLPGYSKAVAVLGEGGEAGASGGNTIPTKDEITEYLKGRNVKFAPNTGLEKLQALYAAEKTKEVEESKTPVVLSAETYQGISVEDLQKGVAEVADAELLKELIASEANGEGRQEYLDILNARLTELSQ
jgi:hypothetical protein